MNTPLLKCYNLSDRNSQIADTVITTCMVDMVNCGYTVEHTFTFDHNSKPYLGVLYSIDVVQDGINVVKPVKKNKKTGGLQ